MQLWDVEYSYYDYRCFILEIFSPSIVEVSLYFHNSNITHVSGNVITSQWNLSLIVIGWDNCSCSCAWRCSRSHLWAPTATFPKFDGTSQGGNKLKRQRLVEGRICISFRKGDEMSEMEWKAEWKSYWKMVDLLQNQMLQMPVFAQLFASQPWINRQNWQLRALKAKPKRGRNRGPCPLRWSIPAVSDGRHKLHPLGHLGIRKPSQQQWIFCVFLGGDLKM